MTDDDLRQQIRDEEHLRLLSIGYWISGATTAFFSLFALIYVAMGWMIVRLPSGSQQPPPKIIGLFIAVFGLGFFLTLIVVAGLKVYAGLCLKRRRARWFCMVVAAVTCLGIPYGTALGVLSFIVLTRPSVEALFVDTASINVPTGPIRSG